MPLPAMPLEVLALKKRSNSLSSSFSGMPTPWSLTTTLAPPDGVLSPVTQTVFESGEYLMALDNRLENTRCKSLGSAVI